MQRQVHATEGEASVRQTREEARTVTSPFGSEAIDSVEHLNDEHGDTIDFIARTLPCLDRAVGARISALDHDGLWITAETAGGARSSHVPFSTRADTADDAFREFYGVVRTARERAPEEPLTSIEQEITPGAIPTWIGMVTAVVDVSTRIRQITVKGGLDDFSPLAPDQFVYVLAPPPGRDALTIDTSFSWQTYQAMPEADRPVGAYYTIRRWNADDKSVDLWVVLHGHDGSGERWARTVEIGSPAGLWGPRDVYRRPTACDRLVVIGDETALPAIAAIMESLTTNDTVTVIASVHDLCSTVELASPANVDMSWVTPTDADPNPLLTAVERNQHLLTRNTYVWGGGESRDMSAVRRFVRDTAGLDREHVSLTGYWRRSHR